GLGHPLEIGAKAAGLVPFGCGFELGQVRLRFGSGDTVASGGKELFQVSGHRQREDFSVGVVVSSLGKKDYCHRSACERGLNTGAFGDSGVCSITAEGCGLPRSADTATRQSAWGRNIPLHFAKER